MCISSPNDKKSSNTSHSYQVPLVLCLVPSESWINHSPFSLLSLDYTLDIPYSLIGMVFVFWRPIVTSFSFSNILEGEWDWWKLYLKKIPQWYPLNIFAIWIYCFVTSTFAIFSLVIFSTSYFSWFSSGPSMKIIFIAFSSSLCLKST